MYYNKNYLKPLLIESKLNKILGIITKIPTDQHNLISIPHI